MTEEEMLKKTQEYTSDIQLAVKMNEELEQMIKQLREDKNLTPRIPAENRLWQPAYELNQALNRIYLALKNMASGDSGMAANYLHGALDKILEATNDLTGQYVVEQRHRAYQEGLSDGRGGCVCDKSDTNGKKLHCALHDLPEWP